MAVNSSGTTMVSPVYAGKTSATMKEKVDDKP